MSQTEIVEDRAEEGSSSLASLSTPDTKTAATPTATEPRRTQRPAVDLYPFVWRWHFYAGLLTAPVLWIVTITGMLYVFHTELVEWRDAALLNVTPQFERKSYTELRQIAEQKLGTSDLEALVVYPEADRSIRFIAHHDGPGGGRAGERHELIHINPYTGEVLGTQIAEHDIFEVVLALHRRLMLGITGRILTELTTCWAILLTATGLYLWWPRGKRNVGVWLPRVRGKFYAVLRDWHAVSGFYMLPLMVIVAVTGLVFSQVMGSTFNSTVKSVGHWPQQEWFSPPKSEPAPRNATPVSIDQVVPQVLQHARPHDAVQIKFAEKPEMAHRAFLLQDADKNSYRSVDVDQYSGQVLRVVDAADLKLMYRVRLWAVSIHMGQIFGLPTKILALLASLVMLALSVTGIWMWWKRRPAGRTGFPRRPLHQAFPLWAWGAIVASACLLPVAGVSFLVFGLIDWIISRYQHPASMAAAR